jgi:hypothetical protein
VAKLKRAVKSVYDESKIKTLSSLEHIRLRTGMYIGRLGDGSNPDDGIYILVKEVIDNSVDEFIMGAGNKILMTVKDGSVRIRDYGRGIPLGKVIDCVSTIIYGRQVQRRGVPVLRGLERGGHQGGERPFRQLQGRHLPGWAVLRSLFRAGQA